MLGHFTLQSYPHSGARLAPRAQVLVNAGQANAATGDKGYEDCVASAAAVAEAMGVPRDAVLIESTGVIGRRIKCGSECHVSWSPHLLALLPTTFSHKTHPRSNSIRCSQK